MSAIDREAIRARCEAATAGPWELDRYRHGGGRLYVEHTLIADLYDPDNREFIAHARQDVSDLLAEVERLDDENRSLRDQLGHVKATADALVRLAMVGQVDAETVRGDFLGLPVPVIVDRACPPNKVIVIDFGDDIEGDE